MDADKAEEFGKKLEEIMDKLKTLEEEITFAPGGLIFRPPSTHCTFMAGDFCNTRYALYLLGFNPLTITP